MFQHSVFDTLKASLLLAEVEGKCPVIFGRKCSDKFLSIKCNNHPTLVVSTVYWTLQLLIPDN